MLLRILIFLLLSGLAPAVAAAETEPACRELLDLGLLEERRARFSEALAALDQARRDPACRDAAEVGLARAHNSMNDHKKALAAARWVLDNSVDPKLRSATVLTRMSG